MKKIYWIIPIVAIIIIAGFLFVYNSNNTSEPKKEIDATKLMYYGANVYIGEEVPSIWQNMSNFLRAEDFDKKFYCVSDGKESQIISYPSPYQCSGEVMPGCGGSRKAIICGEVYFVYDFSSTWGPRLYGPFSL
jgi:hypothetical protein